MEEKFPQLSKVKIIDRTVSRINTDSGEFQMKIK